MHGDIGRRRQSCVWLLGAIYAGTQIVQALSDGAIAPPLFNAVLTLSSFAAAFVHGSIRYGWRGVSLFALLTIVISNLLEDLSIATGFPFGWYHYSDALGPKIIDVPIVIGFAYFSVGYLAWAIANILLDTADRDLGRGGWFMIPCLAAFIMVGWDVTMDPLQSTVAHYWTWTHGGGYFGVPLSNFLGWYLTIFLVYLAFAGYLHRRRNAVRFDEPASYWHQAALLFLACTLPYFLGYARAAPGLVRDARGVAWQLADVHESAVLICLFTMVFAGVAALFKTVRRMPG